MLQKKTTVVAPKQNGVDEENSSKESNPIAVENKRKENKEQNHCQEDSDEHTVNGDRKKKGSYYLPLTGIRLYSLEIK